MVGKITSASDFPRKKFDFVFHTFVQHIDFTLRDILKISFIDLKNDKKDSAKLPSIVEELWYDFLFMDSLLERINYTPASRTID